MRENQVMKDHLTYIFQDLGFKTYREFKINNLICDWVLEFNNQKFIVELKKGKIRIEELLVRLNNVKLELEEEYKLIVIYEEDNFERESVEKLKKIDAIVIDLKKLIKIQKDLYLRSDPIIFFDEMLRNKRKFKYINNSSYFINILSNKNELLECKTQRDKVISFDNYYDFQGLEFNETCIAIDKRVYYDEKLKKVDIDDKYDAEKTIQTMFILFSRAKRRVNVFFEDKALRYYFDKKIYKNPIEFIIIK